MLTRHLPATILCSTALLALCGAPAFAQEAPSPTQTPAASPSQSNQREMPRPEDIDPAVDTSATAPSQSPAPAQTAPAAEPAQKPAPAAKASPAKPAARGKVLDRLELETTEITGNRELPKVLYIVPWKRSDLGDLIGKPVNSLLDEVLEPVDRDVFRRENRYYRALQPESAAAPAPAPPE